MNAAIYSVSQAFRLLRQASAGSSVYDRPSQHARTVGSDQDRCIRRILDGRRNLQKVGLRDLRNRLVPCDVQLARQKVHRAWMDLLSTLATVRMQTTLTSNGLTSKARFAARFSIPPNAAPICNCSRHVRAGRAASDQDDHAGVLLDHMARRGAGGDKARSYNRRERHHELFNR